MKSLSDLVYAKYAPYRQILQIIRYAHGSNSEEIRQKLSKKYKIEVGVWKLNKILFNMETRGILIRVNNVFFLSDDWVVGMSEFLRGYQYLLQDPFLFSLLWEGETIKKN